MRGFKRTLSTRQIHVEEGSVGIHREPQQTNTIAVMPYFMESPLTLLMTQKPDDRKPYGDSSMAAVTRAVIAKPVLKIIELINFEILLRQRIDDLSSSARYFAEGDRSLVRVQ